MKYGPKSVRFTTPVWGARRNLAQFVGRENTIHVQETALVVEGNLKRFSLPIIDGLVLPALSEWSMVTIPYSTILTSKQCYYPAVWICWCLIVGSGFALLCVGARSLADIFPAIGFLVISSLLTALVYAVFRPRFVLVFRKSDDQRGLICFRFKKKAERNRFLDELNSHRTAAAEPGEGERNA